MLFALSGRTPQPTLIGWQRTDGALLNSRDQQRAGLICHATAANAGAAVPSPQPTPQAPRVNISQTTTIYAPSNPYVTVPPPSPAQWQGPQVDFDTSGITDGIAMAAAQRRRNQIENANFLGCMAQNGYLPVYESRK